jgi:translation initiation factor 1
VQHVGLVYSTEGGRVKRCPRCGEPLQDGRCRCAAADKAVPGDGVLRVRRETGGRGGKTVTTISGASPADARDLAKALKKVCGSGGAVKDGIVELQGDHRDKVVAYLQKQGRTAKPAGG